MKSM